VVNQQPELGVVVVAATYVDDGDQMYDRAPAYFMRYGSSVSEMRANTRTICTMYPNT
jgi:hypothetical protein